MRVIVTGAVAWTDRIAIRRELEKLPEGSTVIVGDCQGVDQLAIEVAEELGFSAERMEKNREDYKRYGRGAWKGLNERMLATGVELVIGFHPTPAKSQGTKHMVQIAEAAGVETRVFSD